MEWAIGIIALVLVVVIVWLFIVNRMLLNITNKVMVLQYLREADKDEIKLDHINAMWRLEQRVKQLEAPDPIVTDKVITLAEEPQIELREPFPMPKSSHIKIEQKAPEFDNGYPAYQKDGVWRRANEEAKNLLVQDWNKNG